ncbi:hypothetical protein JAAARDRAFT_175248 [Jaapia argillacea MUCL 33604]|uniref:EGF-like domain-containing protein n=1 Tax=Jaapia argillacea MUCL 33604 TaxID=933084 RepID=A0A067Q8B7_9AGAM|nr:hypothetical protein JAAARDRAFT_175248 [Jaapia argillacea MUCL 33604]
MFSSFPSLIISLVFGASVALAQSNPTVVCVAGQCLQGFSNTTLGVTLSTAGASTNLLLLPGQYTSSTNPQLLHSLLTSSSAKISPSPGFSNSSASSSTPSLPLNVVLQPGIAVYSESLYSSQAAFVPLPSVPASNSSASTPLPGSSLALSSDIWVAVTSGSSNSRIILWDSIPDVSQLPSGSSTSLGLLDIQSSSCSPPCSGQGICSASGTCTCPTGFTGSSCESCAAGFFGPKCQPCPSGCSECDQGISGSGRCLTTIVTNAPSTCNCLNGVCGANGQCTCNAGWTTATNGTACAKCAPGFFLDSNGDCSVCSLGCTSCADGNGDCITCQSGFTVNANDQTSCISPQAVTSTGTTCPDGSFSSGTTCTPCSPLCQTCSGPTSNDCIICGNGRYTSGGNCVAADGNGVCVGSTLIANNNKHECDGCPAKCTSCQIPNFNVASTINQLQCKGCLPGFVLSQGQCVQNCPSGTFLSPQDNLTCTACDSTCSSCAGSSTFCITCSNNQLASSGKCVASCPSNTFSSSGECIPCHPDCASCSGSSFNQCSSCSASRPVLTNGRCLPTCSKSQFFDTTSSTCQACDSSCSSCSGAGASNCLACSSSSQVLRGGSCVAAGCNQSTSVVPGLGVCLSELVAVPQVSGSSTPAPLPTITGLNSPTTVTTGRPLAWWEILLMALGCAFIFLLFLMCWRRRARKNRAKQTAKFASAKQLNQKTGWRWRFIRFGEKLFGHNASKRAQPIALDEEAGFGETDDIKLMKMRNAEEESHHKEIDKLIGSYEYSRSSQAPSGGPEHYRSRALGDSDPYTDTNRLSASSWYSQLTGNPRRAPEPRQPVRTNLNSRFSSSDQSSMYSSATRELLPPGPMSIDRPPTQAEEYRTQKQQAASSSPPSVGSYWIQPTNTGNSSASRNPFRQMSK